MYWKEADGCLDGYADADWGIDRGNSVSQKSTAGLVPRYNGAPDVASSVAVKDAEDSISVLSGGRVLLGIGDGSGDHLSA